MSPVGGPLQFFTHAPHLLPCPCKSHFRQHICAHLIHSIHSKLKILFPTIIKWWLNCFAWHMSAGRSISALDDTVQPWTFTQPISSASPNMLESALSSSGQCLKHPEELWCWSFEGSVSSAMTSMSQNPSECLHQSGSSHTHLPVAPALWVAADWGCGFWAWTLSHCQFCTLAWCFHLNMFEEYWTNSNSVFWKKHSIL